LEFESIKMTGQDMSIAAITSSHGLMHGYLTLLPALIPLLSGDLGNIEMIGVLASLVALFYGWFSLPVGFLADRFSKKFLITLSMFLCGSAAIIVGTSPSIKIATIGLIILGIGASLYHPCGYAHMSLLSDDMRGRYMGIQGMGGDMGMALSFLTSAFLGATYGWRNTFLIWGAAGLLMALIDFFAVREIPCDIDPTIIRKPIDTMKRMFRGTDTKTLLLTFLIIVVSGMLWTGVSNFIMVYITDIKTVALVIAGGLSTLKYTVGAFAQVLGGELSDKMGRKQLLLLGYGLFSLSLVALILAPSDLLILAGLVVVLGFSFFITQGPMNALLGDVTHREMVGVSYGVNFTLKYGIGFFTPAIAGFLAEAYNFDAVFYFFAVLSAIAFGASLLVRVKTKVQPSIVVSAPTSQ
jgi:MFS family permease